MLSVEKMPSNQLVNCHDPACTKRDGLTGMVRFVAGQRTGNHFCHQKNKDPKALISKQFFISLSDWPTNYAKRYDESMQPSTKNSWPELSACCDGIDRASHCRATP